jgi:hypothetical protein
VTEYTINGWSLRSAAQWISTSEGLQTAAPLVGNNVQMPGLDGAFDPYVLGQQRRPDGQGRWVARMSVKGVDPATGALDPGTTMQDYYDNCDELVRRLHARSLVVEAVRPDGSVRRAVGHLAPGESLDFTRERSSPAFGTFVAAVAIPSGRWTDVDPVTTGPQALPTDANLDLSTFADATAVCTDLEVRIHGEATNPRLDKADGFFAYNGAIESGQELLVITRTGVLDDGDGNEWIPGYASHAYSPGPLLFSIDPTQPLEATLTHDSAGSVTVEVSGPRHYRTA